MIATIIMICLAFGSVVLHAAKHGEERGGYNVWSSLIAFVITMLLYWWAGLFDKFIQ